MTNDDVFSDAPALININLYVRSISRIDDVKMVSPFESIEHEKTLSLNGPGNIELLGVTGLEFGLGSGREIYLSSLMSSIKVHNDELRPALLKAQGSLRTQGSSFIG